MRRKRRFNVYNVKRGWRRRVVLILVGVPTFILCAVCTVLAGLCDTLEDLWHECKDLSHKFADAWLAE